MGASISLAITQNSQSVANNTSNVTVAVQVHWTYGTWNALGECYGSITIDGTPYSFSGIIFNASHTTSGSQEVMRKTVDVSHNSDGTKTLSCSASFATCTQYGGTPTTSGSKTLTTIPREAKITAAPDFTDLQNPTISYSNPAGNAVAALDACISFTREKDDIAYRAITKTGSSYTFQLTEAERNVLRAHTPGRARKVYFHVRTKIGSTFYYSELKKTLTIAESEAVKPTVSMSLSVVSSLPSAFEGLYVQGKTQTQAKLSYSLKHNATLAALGITVEGKWVGSPYISDHLPTAGEQSVVATVKDSRGYYGSCYRTITVLPYSKPKLDVSVCARCDADGNLADGGTYLKIKATRSYSKVESGGEQKNFCQIRYRYKRAAASDYSDWTTILPADDLSSNQAETGALLDGALYEGDSYVVQVQAIDDIGDDSTSTFTIPTEHVYMHRTKNGMGLGKYCEGENVLDVAWDIRGVSFNGVYIKTVRLWGGTDIRLQTDYPEWGDGGNRQSFLVFGSANGSLVLGVCIVDSAGNAVNGITNCSASCEDAGIIKLTMPATCWDQFVIMSAKPFNIAPQVISA